MPPRYRSWLAVDIETVVDEAQLGFLRDAEPRKGTKDPAKMAAQVEAKAAAFRERANMNPHTGKIAVVAYQTEAMADPVGAICLTEDDEHEALNLLFAMRSSRLPRHLVGFNLNGFDWPYLLTRARLLGVDEPFTVSLRRYNTESMTDVALYLNCDGLMPHPEVFEASLGSYAKRYGIPHDDTVTGADVGRLWAMGDTGAVLAHALGDVATTVALARRVGILAEREGTDG